MYIYTAVNTSEVNGAEIVAMVQDPLYKLICQQPMSYGVSGGDRKIPLNSVDDGEHRFGFNGQEKDDEVKGSGNAINYKYRVHDSRIGRFFAVDPLTADYPWNSPYAFSENRVIDGIEFEGLEWAPYDIDGNRLDISVEGWQDNVASYEWEGYNTEVTLGTVGKETYYYDRMVPKPGTVESGVLKGNVSIATSALGYDKGGASYSKQVEGATFYGVSNFQPTQEWSRFTGQALYFDATRIGNYRYVNGDLNLISQYENDRHIIDDSWLCQSGNNSAWALPPGTYIGNFLQIRTKAAMVRDGVGFSMNLSNAWDKRTNPARWRVDLRIHPDEPTYIGTDGCIGLQCPSADLNRFYIKMKDLIGERKNQPTIQVIVAY